MDDIEEPIKQKLKDRATAIEAAFKNSSHDKDATKFDDIQKLFDNQKPQTKS